MRHIFTFTPFVVSVLGHQPPALADSRTEIRAMAEMLSPELVGANDPWRIALILRSQIHRNSVSDDSGMPYASTAELRNWASAYRESLVTRKRANACNGLSILYVAALRAYDIPARVVALYSSRTAARPVWSHSSVAILIDGKWIAMDPTTNSSLRDDAGQLLGWQVALSRAKADQIVVLQNDGEAVKESMKWATIVGRYGYKLSDWADQALLGPWTGGPAENISATPWNGKIEFIGTGTWDAWASITGEFYTSLAEAGVGSPQAATAP